MNTQWTNVMSAQILLQRGKGRRSIGGEGRQGSKASVIVFLKLVPVECMKCVLFLLIMTFKMPWMVWRQLRLIEFGE